MPVCRFVLICFLIMSLSGIQISYADEVILKNGMRYEGDADPILALTHALARQKRGPTRIYTILLVDTGWKRVFLPAKQVAEVVEKADLAQYEAFQLKQKKQGRKAMLASIGSYADVTEFDNYGRRRVTLMTQRGPVHIVQGVTSISPRYLSVTGLTHAWDLGLTTSSFSPDVIYSMLQTGTDANNPEDQLAIARFFVQAGMAQQAEQQLNLIGEKFPDLKDRAEKVRHELRQHQATQILAELRRRMKAGQHELAREAVKLFPTAEMTAEVLQEVRDLTQQMDLQRENLDRVIAMLGELQALVEDDELRARLAPLRSEVSERIDIEALPRFDAFLKLVSDQTLEPTEKLSLAYSGWLLGNSNALTDLQTTLNLWGARFHILESLRTTSPDAQNNMLQKLTGIEGVSANRVLQMLPQLPPVLESSDVEPNKPHRIEWQLLGSDEMQGYWVQLPTEYSPNHNYPLIVSLAPAERSGEQELLWWAGTAQKPGQAQRHGYIVISPDYLAADSKSYDYSMHAHSSVIHAIRDARKRFSIDSDRIFLSGHGTGGDAAFDIGMVHPGSFAGVIPIAGMCDYHCKWIWENSEDLAWYIVSGERDRDSLARNATVVNRMMRKIFNVIYAEYKGRGYESYYAEIHRLFEWMSLHQRSAIPDEIDMKITRVGTDRYHWVSVSGLPVNLKQYNVLAGDPARPANLEVKATPGNTIFLHTGAEKYDLWLHPDIINFEKRLQVRSRGFTKFSDFIKPEIAHILEDFRIRGDRQRIYRTKVTIH